MSTMSFSSSMKTRAGQPGSWFSASKDKVLALLKLRFQKSSHGVTKHTGTEGRFRAAYESELVTSSHSGLIRPSSVSGESRLIFVTSVPGRRTELRKCE